jgi:nitrile hydratase accessory protein
LSAPDVLALPRLPRDAEGPVFAEPWQAQAFALTLKLHEGGAFTWTEWAEALSVELARDPADDGSRYYEHWVAALEGLVAGRAMAAPEEMATRKAEWADAYRRTPHGQPVELQEISPRTFPVTPAKA